MQERHMNDIISNEVEMTPHQYADKIETETKNLPDGARTPTPAEIEAMRSFVKAYRKNHPRAKDREIRRLVEKKFKVKILPNQ